MVNVGITGTRVITNSAQTISLYNAILTIINYSDYTVTFHHGCCKGTDEKAHELLRALPTACIYGYPGTDQYNNSPYKMQMRTGDFDFIYPPALYVIRNQNIVNAIQILIACPAYPENHPKSKRSGTWQTIRMARKANVHIIYVLPNGEVREGSL